MNKKAPAILLSAAVIALASLALAGCRTKVEDASREGMSEGALTVAGETIPPSAAPAIETGRVAQKGKVARNKRIQTALKRAGFYDGAIDGIIGPKTKTAIREFQTSRGLKVDGIVGPKTWAELERLLIKSDKTQKGKK